VQHFPIPGETVLGGDRELGGGGKGANQAVAARLAGADVQMVGAVGEDNDGRRMLQLFDDAGVDRKDVTLIGGAATGSAYVIVAESGENSIIVSPGANSRMTEEHVLAALSHATPGTPVLLQLEVPEHIVRVAARTARAAGAVVILNAAPAPSTLGDLLDDVDLLLVNEGELRSVASAVGIDDDHEPVRLAEDLVARTGTVVVCTLGSRGAVAVTPDGVFEQRAPRVAVVDTTAAGDTFAGYLAAALADAIPMYAAVEQAVIAASLTVTRAGAMSAIPRTDEVVAALNKASRTSESASRKGTIAVEHS
jgi:ribokinase